jgi:hypothetical protein
MPPDSPYGDCLTQCSGRLGVLWRDAGARQSHARILAAARAAVRAARAADPDPAPGGGQVGAVLLDPRYIEPGSVDSTGFYNHYSALRSYEDLLGIDRGGTDGLGHLGFAGSPGLAPFGTDVFNLPDHGRGGGGDQRSTG